MDTEQGDRIIALLELINARLAESPEAERLQAEYDRRWSGRTAAEVYSPKRGSSGK